jgi:caa(3)-type oxidase subunit IV
MAAITATDVAHGDGHAEHKSDGLYWQVFVALVLLTGLEVSTIWWPDGWHKVTHSLLIVMMVIKFATVAGYFMHLKGDSKVLKRVFLAGLVLAAAVYLIALGAMDFFQDSGTTRYNYPPRHQPKPPPATDPPPVIREIHHG